MKTAEEWADSFSDGRDIGMKTPFHHRTLVVPFHIIKEIQLDAWKQGMTDAAIFAAGESTTPIANLIFKARDMAKAVG